MSTLVKTKIGFILSAILVGMSDLAILKFFIFPYQAPDEERIPLAKVDYNKKPDRESQWK